MRARCRAARAGPRWRRPRGPPRRSRRDRPRPPPSPGAAPPRRARARRSPAARASRRAMRRRRGDGELTADGRTRVEDHDLRVAGQRQGALEPGRSGSDDGDAPAVQAAAVAHDERSGGPAFGSGRSEVGVDGAEQDRVERAAVLVAGHARPDLRGPSGEQLARHVRIGDQGTCHADEVRAGGQRGFDRVRRAEGVRDQQRPVDQWPDPADVAEQRRVLGRHVAHVGGAHADREVHVVHERIDRREQLRTGRPGSGPPRRPLPPRAGCRPRAAAPRNGSRARCARRWPVVRRATRRRAGGSTPPTGTGPADSHARRAARRPRTRRRPR